MKNKFFKYFLLMVTFLALSGCMEEKEVQGPIPYTLTKVTPINKSDTNTFYGAYLVSNFEPKNNNIVGIDNFTGGFFINYDALSGQLQYKYALKYGGYDNEYTSAQIAYSNEFQTIIDYKIAEDNYTIIFNTPIEVNTDGMTYKIHSVTKNDDIVTKTEMTADMNLDNLTINHTTKLCDPSVTDNSDSDCTSINGAMKYIGYYRIEEITCGNNTYYGGKDFAGEMTASANLNSSVSVPITIKFQVDNQNLKGCVLKTDTSNDLFFKEISYTVLNDVSNLGQIFQNLGLNSINDTYIQYSPKTQTENTYDDMTFGNNNNTIKIKLRIMKQADINPFESPVTLDDIPYWIVNNTGIQ